MGFKSFKSGLYQSSLSQFLTELSQIERSTQTPNTELVLPNPSAHSHGFGQHLLGGDGAPGSLGQHQGTEGHGLTPTAPSKHGCPLSKVPFAAESWCGPVLTEDEGLQVTIPSQWASSKK